MKSCNGCGVGDESCGYCLQDIDRVCPHCGKEHRLIGYDYCLKNPGYNYITGQITD